MKNLYIVKCGSTFDSIKDEFRDFEDWIIDKLEDKNRDIYVLDVQNDEDLPILEKSDVVIFTGSHSMVTDEESWSLNLESWLLNLIKDEIPLLCICYGHQLLAKSLGGVSGYHENGIEIGTVDVFLEENAKNDELFSELENSFKAHTIHSQTVLELPKGAVRLAFNNHDKNHAFRVGSCAWGVQFHPEFDENIMDLYIDEVSKKKDLNIKELKENISKTPVSTLVLKEFERLFL